MNEEEKQRNVSVRSIKKINECHGYGFMSASPEWLHLLCCRLLSSDRCGKNIISKGEGVELDLMICRHVCQGNRISERQKEIVGRGNLFKNIIIII